MHAPYVCPYPCTHEHNTGSSFVAALKQMVSTRVDQWRASMCTPQKTKANSSLLLDARAGPGTCKLQIAALSRLVPHAARAKTWSSAPSQLPGHSCGLVHIKTARVWHGFPRCHRWNLPWVDRHHAVLGILPILLTTDGLGFCVCLQKFSNLWNARNCDGPLAVISDHTLHLSTQAIQLPLAVPFHLTNKRHFRALSLTRQC